MRLIHTAVAAITRLLPPRAGREVQAEPSDRSLYGSFSPLRPEDVEAVLAAADSGDPSKQCILARDIVEKNENIAHAVETRRNAVTGCEWTIEPGDKTAEAKAAAEAFKKELDAAGGGELDTFPELLADLTGALVPGYALSEIVWKPGGKLAGFCSIEPQHVTFRDGYSPLLVTRETPLGMELAPAKFIFHAFRRRGRDASRGGLIRPLAWLHCFGNVNTKNLLRFVETYGMPIFVVKVAAESWEAERKKLAKLIKAMGSGGGAVVSSTTDITAVQPPNANGDAYFRLLEYLAAAVTKVVLGQTATAGDGGGWSNDGAQSKVRQDILEADCRWIEGTINRQLAAPWCAFNFGEQVAPPRFKILCEPPEDEVKKNQAAAAYMTAINTAVMSGVVTPTAEIEKFVRSELGLPPLDSAAVEAWGERAARIPAAFQLAAEAAAGYGSLAMAAEREKAAELPERAAAGLINSGALTSWLGPVAEAIEKAAACGDEAFAAELAELADNPPFGDSGAVESGLADEVYTGIAEGMAEQAARLKKG